MGKTYIIMLLTIVTFGLGGCSLFGSKPSEETETATPTTPEITTEETKAENQDFGNPVEPGKPSKVKFSGLISPTDPDQRAKRTTKGRNNPFDIITLSPVIKVEQPGASGQTARSTSRPQSTASTSGFTTPPSLSTFESGSLETTNRSSGTSLAKLPPPNPAKFVPQLPTLPQPKLANQVNVTGVVQVGDVKQAIIQDPQDSFNRYVKVGDYLSNGQILVKRIEVGTDDLPVVVLEQFGIEVIRQVGDKAETSSSKLQALANRDYL